MKINNQSMIAKIKPLTDIFDVQKKTYKEMTKKLQDQIVEHKEEDM